MLTQEEVQFIETELKRNGVVFENVQHIINTNPRAIWELCLEIQMEEGDLGGAQGWDEDGNWTERLADSRYSPTRLNLAEDIERALCESGFDPYEDSNDDL